MLVLVLFLKIFNPFLQKSTIGVSEQKKKHLTFFDGVCIASTKQFHKEPIDDKV